jgi:hypothetical protein
MADFYRPVDITQPLRSFVILLMMLKSDYDLLEIAGGERNPDDYDTIITAITTFGKRSFKRQADIDQRNPGRYRPGCQNTWQANRAYRI